MFDTETRKTIRDVILSMERPFNLSDLVYKLSSEYGIEDRTLILDVLFELFDNEAISYSEVNDDCWAFSVI